MLKSLRRGALIVALGLLLRPDVALAQAQPAVAAPASRTRAHVDTLASPKLEGRLTGSAGADAAAAYIEAELKRIGARPLPGGFGFRVPFTFTAGVKDEGTSVIADARGRGRQADELARQVDRRRAQLLRFG